MPGKSDGSGEQSPEVRTTNGGSASSAASGPADSLRGLLDGAVQATGGPGKPENHELLQQLRAIAARHAGQPMSVNPVLSALVSVITRDLRMLTAAQREEMNTAVARTLFEDSATRSRLEQLWYQLCAAD
ncbi:MAG: hypothetical protein KDA89_17435 [Planctomycetaceae bacterium]|nr:hypothetical protein [Planctomycetaceae bacterium]